MIRPTLTALALALATPAGAAPDAWLEPGFWIFPTAPASSAEHLAQLCTHGMSLVFSDGSWIAYLAEGERLVVDAETVCSGGAGCTRTIWEMDGTATRSAWQPPGLDRDAAGHLIIPARDGASGQTALYPQQCPAESVRALMVGWLRP